MRHSRQSSSISLLTSNPPSPTFPLSISSRKRTWLIYVSIPLLLISVSSTLFYHKHSILNHLATISTHTESHQPKLLTQNQISPLPIPRRPSYDPQEKFLGYLPHSGYHNQRGELQNALLLGYLLNRTVLVPPIWIGWPTPTELYSQLQHSWTTMVQMHSDSFNVTPSLPNDWINLPGEYSASQEYFRMKTKSEREDEKRAAEQRTASDRAKWTAQGFKIRLDGVPITNLTENECKSYSRACRHDQYHSTYKDTFLAWDFLVDMNQFDGIVRLVDRWDIRERAVESLLNITADDIFVIRDERRYDIQFVTKGIPTDPLLLSNSPNSRFAQRLSLPALTLQPHRLILIGSLFSSARIAIDAGLSASKQLKDIAADLKLLKIKIDRAMVFRNSILMEPADAIRDRLGGKQGYIGVHARIGDGDFEVNKEENMERVWWRIIARMGLEKGVAESMWERIKSVNDVDTITKRSFTNQDNRNQTELSEFEDFDFFDEFELGAGFVKRAPPPLAFIQPIVHLNSLTCRSPLHTSPSLSLFNTPLYLATDSRSPATDATLSIFFSAFPCTFILSDFEPSNPPAFTDEEEELEINQGISISSIGVMKAAVNANDGVPLGRLFLPFLEAIVASKGIMTVGTPASTFSGFAEHGLRDAYGADEE